MPTLRERKNPGAGTKVKGKDASVHREAAGLVAPESLAAESSGREGGISGKSVGEAPGSVADEYIKDTKGSQGKNIKDTKGSQGKNIKDTKGPHGKNIKEGVDEGKAGEKNDGLARALRSEPGSEDDPSRWLRHLFDRFHSGIFTFRPEDRSNRVKTYSRHYEDMPVIPEEKSSLRPPRPSDVDSAKRSSASSSKQEETRRDAPRNTNVPSEQEIEAEEMEHQRYGEAQPQLVPTDMIETMMSAQGRKKESLNDG
ncbi:hypothetical protein GGI42DRAFT_355077 [Trichoderma sp. SZMC 28013]